ncbi:tonB family C-terminal domain protein [Lysobacter antibioticus]|uniref:TonB family C-terminal domain protein n=1 Tax=Lysobacter antibioticus TaxID=84531 RepID=A0A0S2FEL2_LYSAN|nr:tonB family C-terminal domain protein [Lysobacter antibioticus]
MAVSKFVCSSAAVLAVLFAAPVAAQSIDAGAGAPMPAGCPSGGQSWPPPKYPTEIFGAAGTVTLVLDLDRCGQVDQVWIETDSGYEALDRAAVETAKKWRLSPQYRDSVAVPSRVRVPVDFVRPSPEQMAAHQARAQAKWDQVWPLAQVPEVAAARDGSLDGFLPDALPMEEGSAVELIAMARREGRELSGGELGWPALRITDDRGAFQWLLIEDSHPAAPSLVRQRLVSDGKKSFYVSRVLCGAAKATACAKLDRTVRDWPRQQPGPPMPQQLPTEPPLPPRQTPSQRPLGPSRLAPDDPDAPSDPTARPAWQRG